MVVADCIEVMSKSMVEAKAAKDHASLNDLLRGETLYFSPRL